MHVNPKRHDPGATFGDFWLRALRDLGRNFVFALPLFLAVFGWLFVSVWFLQKAENWPSYGETVWVTWTTMTTMGWANESPQTSLGKLLVSMNALAGLVLIGSIVWLFTTSLGRR
jgi:hypothetical protein